MTCFNVHVSATCQLFKSICRFLVLANNRNFLRNVANKTAILQAIMVPIYR